MPMQQSHAKPIHAVNLIHCDRLDRRRWPNVANIHIRTCVFALGIFFPFEIQPASFNQIGLEHSEKSAFDNKYA